MRCVRCGTILVSVPRKIRELLRDPVSAGFVDRGGKGSHRNLKHLTGVKITISGHPGRDVKPYQERAVRKAIEEVGGEAE